MSQRSLSTPLYSLTHCAQKADGSAYIKQPWTLGLAEAVRKAGGVLFTGGLVRPEALAQASAELAAAAKEANHA